MTQKDDEWNEGMDGKLNEGKWMEGKDERTIG